MTDNSTRRPFSEKRVNMHHVLVSYAYEGDVQLTSAQHNIPVEIIGIRD